MCLKLKRMLRGRRTHEKTEVVELYTKKVMEVSRDDGMDGWCGVDQ